MSTLGDRGGVKDILDQIQSMFDAALESMDEQFAGLPFGSRSMTDMQHMAWFEHMSREVYPPEPFITPAGEIVASAWVLALAFVEDGDKELRRYERTKERMMGVRDG